MTATFLGRRGALITLAAACVAATVTGAHGQGVRQLNGSEAPYISLPWPNFAVPGQETDTCDVLTSVRSLEVIYCHGGLLRFRVKPGETVRLSELTARLHQQRPNEHFSLGQVHVHRVFELLLTERHDPSLDEALQHAIESRRSVASVERVGPRHLKITLQEGRPFALGQLLQLYVRALRHRGRITMEDIVEDIVFYPIES